MESYKVVLEGHILPKTEKAAVMDKAGKLLKLDTQKIEDLLTGRPRVIKQNLDKEKARQYVKAISGTGLACHMAPQDPPENFEKTLAMENTGTNEEETPSTCPKCGFDLKPGPKGAPVTECPKCGIILDKYTSESLKKENPAAENPATKPQTPDSEPGITDAPKSLRFCAAVGSLTIPGVVVGLCYPLVATGLYMMNSKFLSQPIPHEAWAIEKLAGIYGMFLMSISFIALIVASFYFIFLPSKKGGTWAQRSLNIEVINADPERDVTIANWIVRAMGQWIYILPLILSVVLLVWLKGEPSETDILICTLIWMVFNIFLMARKKSQSLPDIFSGTRQIVRGGNGPKQTGSLLIISIVCLAISYGGVSFGRYIMTPITLADVKSAQAKQNHVILQQVCDYQEKYYQRYGAYSENPFELLDHCSNPNSPANAGYLEKAADQVLFIEITEEGFLCALPVKDAPRFLFRIHSGWRSGNYGRRLQHLGTTAN